MTLTANELADLRAIADDFFPDTCTIQTETQTVDGMGGISISWANTFENVACRVDPSSPGQEVVKNLQLEAEAVWWLNIPYDQAINLGNRVVHNSITYDVRYTWDNHSYSTINRALLVRIDQ